MRILIAEDDGNIADYLRGKLEVEGYQVSHESNGPAVWERGETEEFDIIVLDLVCRALMDCRSCGAGVKRALKHRCLC